MHTLLVNDLEVEVHRKNIKNLHLGVYPPEGRVRVASPLTIDDEAVRLFVVSKLPWIRRQQKKFVEQPRQSEREYVSGETHFYQGQPYLLSVIYQRGWPKVILRNKTHVDLYVREQADINTRQRVMTEWYRRQLKAEAAPLMEKWQHEIGVEIDEWGVRAMKTRWGSCNIEQKRILLNLELAKKPVRCLEYIIVHELLHLLERQHNDHFIELLDNFLPNWRLLRDELNAFPLKHEHWEY